MVVRKTKKTLGVPDPFPLLGVGSGNETNHYEVHRLINTPIT